MSQVIQIMLMEELVKSLKILIPLFVLCALVVLAVPAVADQPGNNEDPFGGVSIGNGSVVDGVGIVAKFGMSPFGYVLPGSTPTRASGNGTSPRRAINISGIWGIPPGEGLNPPELANCSTVRIPAGNFRWFKLEAYGDRRTRIWLNDELDGATKSSGSATFGAADRDMLGTAPGDGWQVNALSGHGDQSENFLEGFVMAVYDPDNLRPNYAFEAPNAALLSVNVDARGMLLHGPDNLSVKDVTGAGIHGYGSYNPFEPAHLLWYEGQWDGWVFISVYNQMVWDGTMTVCSQRTW